MEGEDPGSEVMEENHGRGKDEQDIRIGAEENVDEEEKLKIFEKKIVRKIYNPKRREEGVYQKPTQREDKDTKAAMVRPHKDGRRKTCEECESGNKASKEQEEDQKVDGRNTKRPIGSHGRGKEKQGIGIGTRENVK